MARDKKSEGTLTFVLPGPNGIERVDDPDRAAIDKAFAAIGVTMADGDWLMATILLLSGPNLNLLGEREPQFYGTTTLEDLVALARETAAKFGHELEHVQSNHEGTLIDAIHGARGRCAAIVCNAGAFSHYAYALTDALAAYDGVKIELHLSNPHAREAWRHKSVLTPVVDGVIAGFKETGYRIAIEAVAARLEET